MPFEYYFKETKGKPFVYNGKKVMLADKIELKTKYVFMRLNFISTNSEWIQGIFLDTKGRFEANGQSTSSCVVLWENTAPSQVEINIYSEDKILFINNVWNPGDGTMHYGHNGGALYVERFSDYAIYHCNDGYPDDDFDDLIFKVELMYFDKDGSLITT